MTNRPLESRTESSARQQAKTLDSGKDVDHWPDGCQHHNDDDNDNGDGGGDDNHGCGGDDVGDHGVVGGDIGGGGCYIRKGKIVEDGETGKLLGERKLLEKEIEDGRQEEEKERDSSLGLDSGYAWLIVFGAFFCWVLSSGFIKSGGIFFLQFQNQFHTGALQAAWPGSIFSLLQNLSGPLVSVVCNRYSVRTSVMIGATLTFIGLVLNSLVNDFYFLFFCHSLLQGVGFGFVLTPGLYIVTSYFDKRRGFAVSLASSGGGVGAFIIVPLITFLFDFYGYYGCFLIMAGMMSNAFVVAMLYRPLRAHQEYLRALHSRQKREISSDDRRREQNGSQSLIPLEEITNMATDSNTNTTNTDTNTNTIDTNTTTCNTSTTITISKTTTTTPCLPSNGKTPTRCPGLKSFLRICFPTEHKGSSKKKLFHFELLRDLSFVLYLVSTFLFTMSTKSFFTFIPAACIDKGLSQSEAALVLSISGAVDTVGRIVMGFLLDTASLKPHRASIYNGVFFCIGLCVFFVPFLSNFLSFVLLCSVMGIFFGAHVSQRAVVIVDLMGKEMLPSCMGLVRVFQAFAMMAGPLLFGGLRDMTGSYRIAFFVGSGLLITAGIVLVASNVVLKMQKKKNQQQQQ